MPESVLVQVGQCGNQIGFNFWETLLQEYNRHNNKSLPESDFCQFLKPKPKTEDSATSLVEKYNARGILIDMEETVINAGLRSSIGNLFPKNHTLIDSATSGNNWAIGHVRHGTEQSNSLQTLFRTQAEACDSLESFLFLFSLGGGTGSGLGSAALEEVANEYPKKLRMIFSVFPSDVDHVIISPYNAVLCNAKLLEHADIVVPFENTAIEKIFEKLECSKFIVRKMAVQPKNFPSDQSKRFNRWNNLIVSTLLDCTSTSRYTFRQTPEARNLKELTSNLAPAKHLIYSIPSVAPVFASDDSSITRLFNEASSVNNVLFDCGSQKNIICGATIVARGEQLRHTVVENNINKLNENIEFANVGVPRVQYGICDLASAYTNGSVVMLSNTSAVTYRLQLLRMQLEKMLQKKSYIHHYEKEDKNIYQEIHEASDLLNQTISSYNDLQIGEKDLHC